MIFQHTIDKVLSGEKTQTRRIVKPGDEFFPAELGDTAAVMRRGYSSYRKIFEVGQTLAVQPGRGKASVARIRITGIRREDVRDITPEDAVAEGFKRSLAPCFEYIQLWASMHDSAFEFSFDPQIVDYRIREGRQHDIVGWETLQKVIANRPAERYQAWALTFEVVK